MARGGTDALGSGAVTMSVTAKGEASGKVSLCGTNFSFSTKSYAARETNGVFTLVTTAKVDKVSLPLVLSVGIPGVVERAFVVPPHSQIGAITPEQRKSIMEQSLVKGVYDTAVDNVSAYEKLKLKVDERQAAALAAQKAADEAQTAADTAKEEQKAREKAQKEADRAAQAAQRQLAIFAGASPADVSAEALQTARASGYSPADVSLMQELTRAMQSFDAATSLPGGLP